MARRLYFEQITDSRFMDRKDCLPILEKRIEKLKELLNLENVSVNITEPRLIEWGNKEDEGKLSPYHTIAKFDTDAYHIQYRSNFYIDKNTRKITWNDIYKLVNSINAVLYDFI